MEHVSMREEKKRKCRQDLGVGFVQDSRGAALGVKVWFLLFVLVGDLKGEEG